MKRLLIGLVLAGLALSAAARDPAQVRAFRKAHPCPATAMTTGACPGYVVDHIIPLCLQPHISEPLDRPGNMAWQERAESLKKDRAERQLCASLRHREPKKDHQ